MALSPTLAERAPEVPSNLNDPVMPRYCCYTPRWLSNFADENT